MSEDTPPHRRRNRHEAGPRAFAACRYARPIPVGGWGLGMETTPRPGQNQNRDPSAPKPDRVEYGYGCIRLFFDDPKVVVVVDIDDYSEVDRQRAEEETFEEPPTAA